MAESSSSGGIGISLASVLTIIFVFLKAFGKIDWSWWWVFSPLWISFAIFIVIMALILGAAGIGLLIAWKMDK